MLWTKTILLSFLLSSFVTQNSSAQTKVEWNGPFDMEEEDEDVIKYTQASGNYFTVSTKPSYPLRVKVIIKSYNESGKHLKTTKYKVGGNPQLQIEMKGHTYMITDLMKFSGYTVKAFKLHPDETEELPDGVLLVELPFKPVGHKVTYHLNPSRTKLYVLEIPGQVKGSNEKWNLKVYDNEMKQISLKSFSLNYNKDLLEINKIKIDQNDNLIFTCFLYEKPVQLFAKPPAYELKVFTLPSRGTELKELSFDTKGTMAQQIGYLEHNDNSFTCYGLYGLSKQRFTSGAFSARFSIDGKMIRSLELRPFPAHVMESAGRRGVRKTETEVFGFNLGEAKLLKDGSLQLVAEQTNDYYSTIRYSSESDGITYTSTASGMQYQHDDILVLRLTPDPSRDWFTLIRKRQASFGEKNYLSFTYTMGNNEDLYILYNDLPGNLEVPLDKEPDNLKSGREKMVTVLATIDKNGSLNRRILFSKKDIDHWFIPSLTRRNGNYLELTTTAKKSYKLGKLKVE